MTPVRVERDAELAHMIFSAPPLNLWDAAMFEAVKRALDELEADIPRALLVRAEGRVVSGGVDVETFAGIGGDTEGATSLWRQLIELSNRMEALPCPTIFAAHALCLTASFELALACDLLVAARGAKFGLVERVVGLTPAMGGTQRLVERAGPARAREFVYTGELFSAETLERWNVVNRVYDDDGFQQAAVAFARDIAIGPTRAHVATKEVVRAALSGGTAAADAKVVDVAGQLFATSDLQNAVRSFLSEGPGKAIFEGR